jgi:hypothetical protein
MLENENVSMTERVMELAMALGKRRESQALSLLCAAAVEKLKGRLKPGLTPQDCGEVFPLGAAWLALAGLESVESGGVESFTAGDVTIRRGEGEFRRKALELQARQVMRPYLRDEGFAFKGVRT